MKKKIWKRTIARWLCLVMILTSGMNAFATEGTAACEACSVSPCICEQSDEVQLEAEDVSGGDASETVETVERTAACEACSVSPCICEQSDEGQPVAEEPAKEEEVVGETTEEVAEVQPEAEDVSGGDASETVEPVVGEEEITGEEKEEILQILEYEDADVKIVVEAAAKGAIPEGASLKVAPITAEDDKEEYAAVEEKLNEKAEDEDYVIAGFLAYDITFIDADGNEVEPDGNVKVTLDYKKATLPETVTAEDSDELDVTVMHLEENAQGEVKEVVDMVAEDYIEAEVKTTENAEVQKAEFVTDSFSVFTITWTNINKTLSININIVDAYGSEITVDGTTNLEISVNDGEVSLTKDNLPDEISSKITAKGKEYTFVKAVIATKGAGIGTIRSATEVTAVRYEGTTAQYCKVDGTWTKIGTNVVRLIYVDHSTFRITWTDSNKSIPVNIVNVYADELTVDTTDSLEISVDSSEVDLTKADESNKIPNVITANGKEYKFLKAVVASKSAANTPEYIRTATEVTAIRFSGTTAQYCKVDGTWTNIGNDIVRLMYVDYDLVDIDREPITAEEYEDMLQTMEGKLNSIDNGNLPITDWKRSNGQNTVFNRASATEDWKWESVAGALELNIEDESRVWDGSRLNDGEVEHYYDYLADNMVTAQNGILYDSASWRKSASTTGSTAQMYRFRGEFNIGSGDPNEYTYTLKTVTEGNRIYINDDIFVFIYPTNVTLNNNNFMDYLAFWTGTVNQNNQNFDFNGRYGTAVSNRLTDEEQAHAALTKITDGWHLDAVDDNVGAIIQSIYNKHVQNGTEAPTQYYVDVFTDDYYGGGGMYRLVMEKKEVTKAEVNFLKLDSVTGEQVKDATFAFDLKMEGNYVGVHYTAESDENGVVSLKLVPGTYVMEESAAPNNFAQDTGEWTIVVGDKGDYTISRKGEELDKIADESSKYYGWYFITNERIKRDVEVLKVNEMGQKLSGAEFTLYSDKSCEKVIKSATTNEKGIALFESLDIKTDNSEFATYYLKETKAPEGYLENNQVWTVTVSAEKYTITDTDGNEVTEIVNIAKKGDLIINKSLPVFNATIGGATFVFQIEAMRDGESVYSDVVSMTFNAPGAKSIQIKDLPAGAEVTVTEVYSGASYKLDNVVPQTATIEFDKAVEVGFKNTYNEKLNGGSGIVNTFTYSSEGFEWNGGLPESPILEDTGDETE